MGEKGRLGGRKRNLLSKRPGQVREDVDTLAFLPLQSKHKGLLVG